MTVHRRGAPRARALGRAPWLAVAVAVALCVLAPPAGAAAAVAAAPYGPPQPTKGALSTDGQDNRYLLGGTWYHRADPGNTGTAQGFSQPGSLAAWTPVSVPNSFNAGDFSTASMAGGVGWYRRDFAPPTGAFDPSVPAVSRRWILRFESVNYTATVWLNGHQLGSHAGAYLPFEFDLRDLRAGTNVLVVRVSDVRGPTDLPAGPNGGWWNFGGIQREVYLRAVQRVDIPLAQIRPQIACATCPATVREQVTLRNPTTRRQTVVVRGTYGTQRVAFGTYTLAPGATTIAAASVPIAHPHLWTIGDPHLYRARVVLRDLAGHALGGYTVLSGIRIIKVVGGHLTLNGHLLYLRGVNIHEQDLAQGAAITGAQLADEIGWVRELGATVIRAHYPLNPQTLEAADRDGILVWSEIPVYGVQAQYYGDPTWQAHALDLLKTNILDLQNHPSVMLWSIGNEFPTPAPVGEASYIAAATLEAHQLDPTRPVGLAIDSWPGVPCQSAYAPLDVIGYNDYFGWFDAGGGTTDDRDALSGYLDSLHACYPDKALMITEFGFEASRPGPVEERGTYSFSADAMQFHVNVFNSKPYLSAAMWFAMQDFAARPGWSGGDPVTHAPFVEKGVVDLHGNLKPTFAVMSSLYHAVTQIAPDVARRGGVRKRSL